MHCFLHHAGRCLRDPAAEGRGQPLHRHPGEPRGERVGRESQRAEEADAQERGGITAGEITEGYTTMIWTL